jgi:hypothetical protein
MQPIAHPDPTCQKCKTGMVLNGITRCAERYHMSLYRCLSCSGTLHMVEACTAAGAAMFERRGVARHRVITPATIGVSGGTLACIVRNVSAAGACLDIRRSVGIPRRFILTADGSHLPCQVVWRGQTRIGIAFKPIGAAAACG